MTKKNPMKQYALAMIAIGAILMLVGGYQTFNPVLAVSAHDDTADIGPMLAITTFEVSEQEVTCTDATPNFDNGCELLKHFDDMVNSDGVMTIDELVQATLARLNNQLTYAEHVFILGPYTYEQWDTIPDLQYTINSFCVGCYTTLPAQINDETDTLVTDKTVYDPGELVTMIAWGENIGGETWSGKVVFTVTQPNGVIYTTKEYTGIAIGAGLSEFYSEQFTLPSSAASGTWTIDSAWIDNDGVVHARAVIDLGAEDVNKYGVLIALLGLLLVIGGLMARKD